MRSEFALLFIGCTSLTSGCAAHRHDLAAAASPPVVVSETVREGLPNDYLRVSFLLPNVKVTTLSHEGAVRAFATATPLFSPPLSLQALPYYSGLVNDDTKVLTAMRCKPKDPATVDALLATWPNVFSAIQRDVPWSGVCESHPASPAAQAFCFARDFKDPPQAAVPTSLAHTFDYAGKIYDGDHAELAGWLQDKYGIYQAFSGTGYSVKDSYSLASQPMNSQQIFVKSISSEYILKNVSLAEAGCHCISVPPYSGRSSDRLVPDFIDKAGGTETCTPVERLQPGPPSSGAKHP
jgi:hypothetical protein